MKDTVSYIGNKIEKNDYSLVDISTVELMTLLPISETEIHSEMEALREKGFITFKKGGNEIETKYQDVILTVKGWKIHHQSLNE